MIKVYGIKKEIDCEEQRLLCNLLEEIVEGVEFSCEVKATGEFGDAREPVIMLPNGKTINLVYMEHDKYEECE